MDMAERQALGRGLSALIPHADSFGEPDEKFFLCPIETLEPNPLQPRQHFSSEELDEMAASVREKGILTPLLVSRTESGYQIIAGERRWRAAQKAGLDRVPVVVREVAPGEALELALIENIHRTDLNPIEEALAYEKLLEQTGGTHAHLAEKLGKDRSHITNLLRILSLPLDFRKDVIDGTLSMGHARVLAGLKDPSHQRTLRDKIVRQNLSVRQTESQAKKIQNPPRTTADQIGADAYIQSLADNLKRSLGTKVEIKKRGKHGSIVVHFYSDAELDRLLNKLT